LGAGGLKMKTLTFYVKELADMYAMKTLHDYLQQKELPFQYEFMGRVPKHQEIFGMPIHPVQHDIENLVTVYSDVGGGSIGLNNLEIDISILKNAVQPITQREREALRQKYGISSERPVLVISYATGIESEMELIRACKDFATTIVMTDLFPFMNITDIPEFEGNPYVKCVTKLGVLRDYYALADAAVNSNNLSHNFAELHNFVEATAGGPLFMVPSSRSQQYGYPQLVNRGVIRECQNSQMVISEVTQYLRTHRNHNRARNARARHLIETREMYLPVLEQYLLHTFMDGPKPESDLVERTKTIERRGKVERRGLRISHPQTDWRCDPLCLPVSPNVSLFETLIHNIILTKDNLVHAVTELVNPSQKDTVTMGPQSVDVLGDYPLHDAGVSNYALLDFHYQ